MVGKSKNVLQAGTHAWVYCVAWTLDVALFFQVRLSPDEDRYFQQSWKDTMQRRWWWGYSFLVLEWVIVAMSLFWIWTDIDVVFGSLSQFSFLFPVYYCSAYFRARTSPGSRECYFCCSCSVRLDCSHFNTRFPFVLCSRSWDSWAALSWHSQNVRFGLLTKVLVFPVSLKELKLVCREDIFEVLIQIFSLYLKI